MPKSDGEKVLPSTSGRGQCHTVTLCHVVVARGECDNQRDAVMEGRGRGGGGVSECSVQ